MWTSSLSRYPETHDSTLSYTFLFLWFFSWKVLNLYPRTTNDNVSVSPSYGHGILHAIYCFSSVFVEEKRQCIFNDKYFILLFFVSLVLPNPLTTWSSYLSKEESFLCSSWASWSFVSTPINRKWCYNFLWLNHKRMTQLSDCSWKAVNMPGDKQALCRNYMKFYASLT